MSKKKPEDGGKLNKSKAIREYYASNPKAKPKAIAEALNAQGHKLTAQYVSVILSGDRKRSGKVARKPGRPRLNPVAAAAPAAAVAAPKAVKAAKASSSEPTYSGLASAKALIDATGGAANARAALDAYLKLTGN